MYHDIMCILIKKVWVLCSLRCAFVKKLRTWIKLGSCRRKVKKKNIFGTFLKVESTFSTFPCFEIVCDHACVLCVDFMRNSCHPLNILLDCFMKMSTMTMLVHLYIYGLVDHFDIEHASNSYAHNMVGFYVEYPCTILCPPSLWCLCDYVSLLMCAQSSILRICRHLELFFSCLSMLI